VAGGLLLLLLLALPRPIITQPPLQRRLYAALAGVAVVSIAALLAVRERPSRPDAPAGETLRVATWNVHLGFDEAWRYEPGRIMRAIGASGADIIALQEVSAAMPAAYGTDLGLYFSRRLGLRLHFAPSHNRLMGDAFLTRVHASSFESRPLPPRRARPAQLATLAVPWGRDTLHVFATQFGLSPAEQRVQADAVATATAGRSPAVLLGNLNARPEEPALLRLAAAGFEDAFAVAGAAPAPTYPAGAPDRRIDWILTRAVDVGDAAVLPARGSYHLLVTATLRPRP
jgi:endonuclease/exonuclease/phosphatase family metal-dependent hydrolase